MKQQLCSEQALQKREAELQMVLQNANDAYVCIDHNGVIREWNQQAEQTFGQGKSMNAQFLFAARIPATITCSR